MFEIGWTEMLVIAVVMIVVVGPKDLPKMLRTFGRTAAKLRGMAAEFQKQFNEALREAELDDVKKSVNDLRSLNPASQIREQLSPFQKAAADVKSGVDAAMKPKAAVVQPAKAEPTESPAGAPAVAPPDAAPAAPPSDTEPAAAQTPASFPIMSDPAPAAADAKASPAPEPLPPARPKAKRVAKAARTAAAPVPPAGLAPVKPSASAARAGSRKTNGTPVALAAPASPEAAAIEKPAARRPAGTRKKPASPTA